MAGRAFESCQAYEKTGLVSARSLRLCSETNGLSHGLRRSNSCIVSFSFGEHPPASCAPPLPTKTVCLCGAPFGPLDCFIPRIAGAGLSSPTGIRKQRYPNGYRCFLVTRLGLSHALRNSPPDCFLPSRCSGRAFESHRFNKELEISEWISPVLGDPPGTRTQDTRLKRAVLYRLS